MAPVRDRAARDASGEGEMATVGGDLGRVGTAARGAHLLCPSPGRDVDDLAGAEVLAPHLPVPGERVASLQPGRARVDVEVQVAPILGRRWPRGLRLVPDHLDPVASVDVVHPDPATARLAPSCGHILQLDEDVLAVGGPGRLDGASRHVAEHLAWAGAVRVHQPQVVLPPPVADERDGLAIGRIAGMVVRGNPGARGQELGLAAPICGDAVDVAQKVEDDPATVRRDVHRHPGALVGREVDLAGLAAGEGDIPVGVGVLAGVLRGEGSREGGPEAERNDGGDGASRAGAGVERAHG